MGGAAARPASQEGGTARRALPAAGTLGDMRRAPGCPPTGGLRGWLLLVCALLAACGGQRGGELRPLEAPLGEGLRVRALFAGDELVYAFVADGSYRVMMMKEPPATPPAGLLYCFGVEDGLYLDGAPVARPAGARVFALLADGSAVAIELSGAERDELARSLRSVRGPLEDEALERKLRAALGE